MCLRAAPPTPRLRGEARQVALLQCAACVALCPCHVAPPAPFSAHPPLSFLPVQLSSEHMTAIASRNAAHPVLPVLASATNSGRIHVYR